MKTRNALSALAISLLATHLFTAEAQNYKAGLNAGASLTTGKSNTFVGTAAGNKTTTGSYNSFYGNGSGAMNVAGNENSFFGALTGVMNTASSNSFFGYHAGGVNTTGQSNSFFGHKAGFRNTTGLANVFVGASAGENNTTASHNTFMGRAAGNANTTGGNNSFFGSGAGNFNTTGTNNTFIGGVAGFNVTTAKHNTMVGAGTGLKTKTGAQNTFLGTEAGWNLETGSDNVYVGYQAGKASAPGSTNNLAVGAYANVTGGSNAAAIGYRAYASASNTVILGSIAGLNGATATAKVGIGLHTPAYRLHVQGDAAKPGSSAWTVASDKRLKKDVKDFKDGLAVLRQIRPVQYQYNGKAGMPTGKEYVGVIAQEVEAVAPYMIHTFAHADSTGAAQEYLDFDATALPYIIINAIKEQQQALEAKDAQVQALADELKALRKELEDLRKGRPGKPDDNAKATAAPGSEGSGSFRKPSLSQNAPNPFGGATVIGYQIPTEYRQAYLSVRTLGGLEVKRFILDGKATGEVTLDAGTFPSGTYLYQLWIDGQLGDSKKMILTR